MLKLNKFGNCRQKSFAKFPRSFCVQANSNILNSKILSPDQQKLLDKEVGILNNFVTVMKNFNALPKDVEDLQISIEQLKDMFLLVVVGEFNSGKSSFLNAMLGKKFLTEGVIPTTTHIDLLRYGKELNIETGKNHRILQLPVDWLKDISLVDTPGTNAIFQNHQQITEHFLPRADLVLWVTSIDRAFSESERKFLEHVKQYQKKVVIILSKIDFLEDISQLNEIKNFIAENYSKLIGSSEAPVMFPVSSKLAIEAKTTHNKDAEALQADPKWIKSAFGDLESYILQILGSKERTMLKLMNPVGLAFHFLGKYTTENKQRLSLVREDEAILVRINEELETYRVDMRQDFTYHIDRIDNCLSQFSLRGGTFFDENVSIRNVVGLLHTDLNQTFERDVINKIGESIDTEIGVLADWMLKKNSVIWARNIEFVNTRAASKTPELIGKIATQFDYDRQAILTDLESSARKVIQSYDYKKEAQNLANEVKSGIYRTAAVEMGALGSTFLLSSLFDFTGILAGTIAISGLGILPYTRYKLKNEFYAKVEILRQNMKKTLHEHFEAQLQDGVKHITDNINPYSTFIKTQSDNIEKTKIQLEAVEGQVTNLKEEIRLMFRE
jgi:small GTP-binding protein